jgi:hypothetical protein
MSYENDPHQKKLLVAVCFLHLNLGLDVLQVRFLRNKATFVAAVALVAYGKNL